MKIFVAIPVYDGKLPVETVRCLLDESIIALGRGDNITVNFLPYGSHAALGRNQLAQLFLDSECDRMVYLDSDITFDPGSIVRIAHHPVDFVGGAYRYKFETENYPVGWLPEMRGLPLDDKSALLEMSCLPGGFLSLSRKVFEDLKKAHPDRDYEHFGKHAHCFFQMRFDEGRMWGEDSHFCKEWIDLGGKVYLDPELTLTHWDFNRPFKGHVGNWLKKMNRIPSLKETA